MTLKDQSWVLVTGASSGFGEEFARQFAAQGRALVLVARRLEKLQALASELRKLHGVDVIVEPVDLSVITAIVELHKRLRQRGIVIDVLINNAGHGWHGRFLDAPLAKATAMVDVDVAGLTTVTRLFAEDMRARGHEQILMVASVV